MKSFCAHCGTKLQEQPPSRCSACSYWTFLNATPSASAVIVCRDQFLAVRRLTAPFHGQWDIPGGFCEAWEHPEVAVVRETKEETGLNVTIENLIGLYMDVYDFQGDRNPTLNVCYICRLQDPRQTPHASAETENAEWFSLNDPPELAFEHLASVIQDVRLLLKDRLSDHEELRGQLDGKGTS